MDRKIPKKEIRQRRLRQWGAGAAIVAAASAAVWGATALIGTSIAEQELKFATVSRGDIDIAADASGKVVPASEIIISAPLSSKILELNVHEGKTVEIGEPLMKLDLQSQETEVRVLTDEKTMKNYATRQAELASRTLLTNLEMQIKTKEMQTRRLLAELNNERRLDSIGSGTGDRVREADLAYRTAILELNQLRTQLANERNSSQAAVRSLQIEEGISARNIAEKQRMLRDAEVRSPIRGTVTWLNQSVGAAIGAGERLAVIANLSHFKIEGSIGEVDADKLTPGAPAQVTVGGATLAGQIATVNPQSKNGVISFTVILNNDSLQTLKPGTRAALSIPYDTRTAAVRIPAGSFYHGPGEYTMFVKKDGKLHRRTVTLGGANFNSVEVVSGLATGETICTSDLKAYKDSKTITLK